MTIEETLAANVEALKAFAAERNQPELATQKGIAAAAGVARKTIQDILKHKRGTGIDNLERLAAAFQPLVKIEAWQLLLDGLVPADLPLGETQAGLMKSICSTMRNVPRAKRNADDGQAVPDSSGLPASREVPVPHKQPKQQPRVRHGDDMGRRRSRPKGGSAMGQSRKRQAPKSH